VSLPGETVLAQNLRHVKPYTAHADFPKHDLTGYTYSFRLNFTRLQVSFFILIGEAIANHQSRYAYCVIEHSKAGISLPSWVRHLTMWSDRGIFPAGIGLHGLGVLISATCLQTHHANQLRFMPMNSHCFCTHGISSTHDITSIHSWHMYITRPSFFEQFNHCTQKTPLPPIHNQQYCN
jgi:hypothetical protein